MTTRRRPKKASTQSNNEVGIRELKNNTSAIIDRVVRTRRVTSITKNNRPVARIVPINPADTGDDNPRQRLLDMGLLASPATLSCREPLDLEPLELDASKARSAIRSDRDEE